MYKALHGHSQVIDRNGKIANVAITSVKTWKTRPDVKVGWKFGLYEYGQELIISDDDNQFFVTEYTPFDYVMDSIELTEE